MHASRGLLSTVRKRFDRQFNPADSFSLDINQLWRKVARQYLSNDDAVVEAFYFRVADRSQGAEQLPYDDMFFGIPLRFGYDLKWPMDLIFTERDMQRCVVASHSDHDES